MVNPNELRQTSKPCKKCGSYYVRGSTCNICGTVNEEAQKEMAEWAGEMAEKYI
jgi:ribosomal protein L37E